MQRHLFWQIPLAEESSKLTTFLTPRGRFRFTRLPFGLNSGSEVFRRVMSDMLEGIEGAICYIDYVLVWGDTKEQHDQRLHQVLHQCRQQGLRLNAAKFHFRASQVKYFGHTITPDGDKIRALVSMAAPTSRDELRRFNGMVSYLAKFLPNLSEVTGPLRDLLKDYTEWYWGSAQETAFANLKQLLANTPVLAFYSSEAPTIVSADASSYGMGAVLLQEQQNGRRAPVAYASCALNNTKK